MLTHPTLDKLHTLNCAGMAAAFTEQMALPDIDSLSFEERLGLLVDRELTERNNRRIANRLRRARLKHQAAIENIDYRHPRGLDKALIQSLVTCQWVRDHLNVLITGPPPASVKPGSPAPWRTAPAGAGYTALYLRLPRLLQDLTIAKGDGRYPKLINTLARTQLLILDDWGLVKLTAEQRRDLLEILEDRHGVRSTLATSQLPVEKWHATIGAPTLADAILDRLVHNAYKINLKGESMRKQKEKLTTSTLTES